MPSGFSCAAFFFFFGMGFFFLTRFSQIYLNDLEVKTT